MTSNGNFGAKVASTVAYLKSRYRVSLEREVRTALHLKNCALPIVLVLRYVPSTLVLSGHGRSRANKSSQFAPS